MASTKQVLAAGAAAAVMAAGGAAGIPAPAAAAGAGALEPPVGSVFSGTIEIASTQGLLVGRKQKKGGGQLIAVDTDASTVVSKGGLERSVEDLASGAEVIVSGAKQEDGSILASKIIIRN
ncbi:MAG TPA: DUF5666 domain-containing protein [Candidatus Paceibacterota bacterium]|nr:DUF5666 domain-containing protein [Candidatus Paceibacterota bacterium]